ncbi:MAG: Usg family protein [Alphaproteobacteria bacterium]|nr:Usg family protein [Alphaproteobacteria bacterium]
MANFEKQIADYRLTTANILYHMPDHPAFLQEFIWQEYDIHPKFPVLRKFLAFWEKEIEGSIHSVYIAHMPIITPGDSRFYDAEFTLH